MSVLDTLVTDRTQEDVDLVRLLNQAGVGNMGDNTTSFRSGNLKGAYNRKDLNRVEEAVEYMASSLVQAQTDLEDYADSIGVAWDSYYDMPYDTTVYSNIVVKKNWAFTDIPSATQMTRYLNNLVLIKAALMTNAPLPSSMDNLTFEGANQIEQMLLLAYRDLQDKIAEKRSYIDSTANAYRCGEIYSGEGDA